ncbi:electron carrier [Coemansia sp. RSA 1813]|nr:electron carrier [Coemansia sp. RSA 1843]KAJ2210717.1 electron carrier [Coemansia sp. RSA 487]KAJ2563450.1 electron carrier [Coemansia sp. RSA 1813]
MSLTMHNPEAGQAVLLVARARAEANNLDALQQLRNSLLSQVGSSGRVDFEQVDRIEEGAVKLASASYDLVLVSPVEPRLVEHSSKVLGKLLLAVKPKGKLVVHELALDADSMLETSPVTRTKEDIIQQLKFAGFVDTEIDSTEDLSEQALRDLAETHWNLANVSHFVSQARGHLRTVMASAKKPAYNVGAAAALSFGNKAKKAQSSSDSDTGKTQEKKVWMLNVESDDEAEIEDQDGLLEEEDLIKPNAKALARPDGIKPRRKPCKNCTCGLAEGGDVDESAACAPEDSKPKMPRKPVDVVNVKSSCGSCSLGDAFRCTACPYLGMPAFKPGEKVTLGGSMLHDDLLP